jgi:hypothetical protein
MRHGIIVLDLSGQVPAARRKVVSVISVRVAGMSPVTRMAFAIFRQAKKTRHTGGFGMEVGVGLTLKYQMLHIH